MRELSLTIKKGRAIIIITGMATALVSFLYLIFFSPPPYYSTKVTLFFDTSKWPAEFLGDCAFLLTMQKELVLSTPVIEEIAKNSHLAPEKGASPDSPVYRSMLNELKKNLRVTHNHASNIITITARAEDAEKSFNMAQAAAKAYQKQEALYLKKTLYELASNTRSRIKSIEAKLKNMENELGHYANETGLLLNSARKQASIDDLLLKMDSDREKTAFQIATINTILQPRKAHTPSSSTQDTLKKAYALSFIIDKDTHPEINLLRKSLLEFSLQKKNLLFYLKEKHPAIQELNFKLKNTRKQILLLLSERLHALQKRRDLLEKKRKQFYEGNKYIRAMSLKAARLKGDINLYENLLARLKKKEQMLQWLLKEDTGRVVILKTERVPPGTLALFHRELFSLGWFFFGLLLGSIVYIVIGKTNTSTGNIQIIEKALEIPALGVIPNLNIHEVRHSLPKEKHNRETIEIYARFMSHFLPKSLYAESFQILKTNLKSSSTAVPDMKSLLITSAGLQEGKTACAINLTLTLAQSGKRVLLVEADLRRPIFSHLFGFENGHGLTDILLGICPPRDAIKNLSDLITGRIELDRLLITPGLENIHLITSGSTPSNPSVLLQSKEMTAFVSQMEQEFDLIVFDAPPVLPVPDSLILSTKTHGVLFVYKDDKTLLQEAMRAIRHLKILKANIAGFVLNDAKPLFTPDYYRSVPYLLKNDFSDKGMRASSLFGFFKKKPVITTLFIIGCSAAITGVSSVNRENLHFLKKCYHTATLQQTLPPFPKTVSFPTKFPHSSPEMHKNAACLESGEESSSENKLFYPYSIMVSSNRELINARITKKELMRLGYNAHITPAVIPGKGTFYRVFVGNFTSKDKALEYLKKNQEKLTGIVLRTSHTKTGV